MLFIPIAFATDNAALDHEGRAVGVAVLWGYVPSGGTEKSMCH